MVKGRNRFLFCLAYVFGFAIILIGEKSYAAPSLNVFSGHIVGNFVINYLQAPPAGSTALCVINIYSSEGSSAAVEGLVAISGNTATCSVNGGYTFRVGNPSATTLSINYGAAWVPGNLSLAQVPPGIPSEFQLYDTVGLPPNGGWINLGTQYLYQ